MGEKSGFFGRGVPHPLTGGVAQPESAGLGHASIKVFEVDKHGFNLVPDAAVVLNQMQPVRCAAVADGGLRQTGNDGRLRQQLRRCGRIDADRNMHHAHGVFHRYALRAASLQVHFSTTQTRQYQCLAAVDHVAAVELGGDVHRQIAIAQRLPRHVSVWRGRSKITAQGKKHLAAARQHQLDGVNRVHTVVARRLKAKHFFELVEQACRGLFPNAHGAIALHIAVAAHWARPRARPANVAAHKQQIDQHLNRGH